MEYLQSPLHSLEFTVSEYFTMTIGLQNHWLLKLPISSLYPTCVFAAFNFILSCMSFFHHMYFTYIQKSPVSTWWSIIKATLMIYNNYDDIKIYLWDASIRQQQIRQLETTRENSKLQIWTLYMQEFNGYWGPVTYKTMQKTAMQNSTCIIVSVINILIN